MSASYSIEINYDGIDNDGVPIMVMSMRVDSTAIKKVLTLSEVEDIKTKCDKFLKSQK